MMVWVGVGRLFGLLCFDESGGCGTIDRVVVGQSVRC